MMAANENKGDPAMTLAAARALMPLTTRLDWRKPRLSWIPRKVYGDLETFRMRLERRLRALRRR
jgi:hypothetical protein